MNKRLRILIITVTSGTVVFLFFFFNFQFWSHYQTDKFNVLTEFNGDKRAFRGRQILVHKDFVKHLKKIDRYALKCNVQLIVNSSYRLNEKDIEGSIVKPSKASNHLVGHAIDFNIIHNNKTYFADTNL